MPRYGFFPAPGTNYSVGQEPEIARRLNQLARALHLHLIGISGYRSPQHSVAVGGFANDPHTRGQASDTPGIEGVSESTLRRYGLTRPFPGAREADHIQLLGGGRGSTRPPRSRGGSGPAEWLKQGGWPSRLWPVAIAIGGAESHWQIDATHTNSDGSTDDGWLQINSVHGFDRERLRSDPIYTARAGYQVYRSQGFDAWTTYTSGAYKAFMGQRPTGDTFGRTRPGGDTGGRSDPDTVLASFWDYVNPLSPHLPDPIHDLGEAGKAIGGVGDFLKWIAWIFHPLNILRIVEFQIGFPLILMGIWLFARMWSGASRERPMKLVRRAVKATPPGRAAGRAVQTVRMGTGRRAGRQARESMTRGSTAVRRGEVRVQQG